MPNGRSFNRESIVTTERGKPRDTLCRKLACCLSAMYVRPSVCNRCQKTIPLPIRANDQLAPPHYTRGLHWVGSPLCCPTISKDLTVMVSDGRIIARQ